MAVRVDDLLSWLQQYRLTDLVGIDDGGLALQIVGQLETYEIGGLPLCDYADPGTCRGPLWQCDTCKESFCAHHNHVTDLGVNVECVACERNRKETPS